jgi:hypothetical protein
LRADTADADGENIVLQRAVAARHAQEISAGRDAGRQRDLQLRRRGQHHRNGHAGQPGDRPSIVVPHEVRALNEQRVVGKISVRAEDDKLIRALSEDDGG